MIDRESDEDLGGSHTGATNLFKKFSPMVYKYAFQALRGDRHRAEDIVQQVFEQVWKQYDRDFATATEEHARRLIKRIVACRVHDLYRRTDPAISVADYADHSTPAHRGSTDTRDPLDLLLAEYDLRDIIRMLKVRLTGTEYQILLMASRLGLEDAEIAAATNKTLSTVRSHRSRARKKIESMLPGHYRLVFDTTGESDPHDFHGGELPA
ncbi:RNA polymerase sigma factor [Nocardia sp. alder85J]|uniref:RNA polymerase sigma factor n=1 Tax=Nocardia sp. alder85J TaxID=2862949 RepID=UPI001CD69D2A|nr:sigma-70 family RNA polymerase sigma factor [Nocardia sp. alder85J]MCX4093831.1 sigma-70 family RNA polymerase sigma factor [Nocardia sp. alder85J]